MKYYVWLEYYAASPVSKNVKSDELMYYDGHQHGVQPSQTQVNTLSQSLIGEVDSAYDTYNKAHVNNPASAPAPNVITADRTVKTRSAQ
ncbi:hypothetical protein CU048_05890 [Beijerinckiaceae bacterium]|nr:hypothetical protein CU048_05890 [Beijerinckiaceae bacterium]